MKRNHGTVFKRSMLAVAAALGTWLLAMMPTEASTETTMVSGTVGTVAPRQVNASNGRDADSANSSSTLASSTIPGQITGQDGVMRVMAVGGSSAHGWADPHDRSYLKRAFDGLASSLDLALDYDDQTIPGAPAASIPPSEFTKWLAADKPQVVAISWGLLDDAHNHTPIPTFEQVLHDEIQQSLAAHAVVFVVTPPAVVVSAGKLHDAYKQYATAEYGVVNSLSNPNVYWFDLHAQTLDFIQGHNRNMMQYCSGTWHPNTRGQALAGGVLFGDLRETFGSRWVTFMKPAT